MGKLDGRISELFISGKESRAILILREVEEVSHMSNEFGLSGIVF